MRRILLAIAAMALLVNACSNLGLGDNDCTPPNRDVSAKNILTLQAVPSAKYTPCIRDLPLGWDEVVWFARNGEAGFKISESLSPFLTATVTPSCDIGDAAPAASRHPDIDKYEDIDSIPVAISITIVPSGEEALLGGRILRDQLRDSRIDDRPVRITVDEDEDASIMTRVDRALAEEHIVWIITDLDAAEGTVELRSNEPTIIASGVNPIEALEIIEDNVAEVFYRGHWYFTFEGGCITYEFDARGILAETVAADADDSLGFFPAFALFQIAEEGGFDLIGED